MSFDLQVWSVEPLGAGGFRRPDIWQPTDAGWTCKRRNWQIVVHASARIEPEDVPDDVARALPGIDWLTNFNLEGNSTSEALRLLNQSAVDIARRCHGVILDPQNNSIRFPSGVKRLMLSERKEAFDVVSLSWWFLDSPLESPSGRERFVDLLERVLPECLPKRYGLYEPPQNVYAETGRDHFLQFLNENAHDLIVWYPNRPVASFHLGLPDPRGPHRLGFRANHINIEIERRVLSEPGWTKHLKKFWIQASLILNPLYGDVRVLGGYEWMGATVSKGQRHPVTSWWWTGIPEDLGKAVVLGREYQRLWPRFNEAATNVEGYAFASEDDWMGNGDIGVKVGKPPEEQLAHSSESKQMMTDVDFLASLSKRRTYPSGWPFGQPFAS